MALQRMALVALTEICKHTEDLTSSLLEKEGALSLLERLLGDANVHIRRTTCSLIAQLCKHTVDSAERIAMQGSMMAQLHNCLKDGDKYVRKNSVQAIWQIVKHPAEHSISTIQTLGSCRHILEYIWTFHQSILLGQRGQEAKG